MVGLHNPKGWLEAEVVFRDKGNNLEANAANVQPKEEAAEQTLLRKGDRIVTVDDRLVTNAFDLERAFWDKKPGEAAIVTLLRDGKQVKVTLVLAGDGIAPQIKD